MQLEEGPRQGQNLLYVELDNTNNTVKCLKYILLRNQRQTINRLLDINIKNNKDNGSILLGLLRRTRNV